VYRNLHWAVKNTKNTASKIGKNDTALIPVLNTFKITTFPHFEHRSNMTEYSFYKGIRYRCQAKFLTSAKSDLILFVSYFASQNKGIKFGNYFFDVCCAN